MESVNKSRPLTSPKLVLEGLIWAVLVLIAWWWTLSTTGGESRFSIIYSSALSVGAGVRVFVGHGRGTITATGLFGLSTAMFIGYSGFLIMDQSYIQAGWKNLALASTAGLTAQVITSMLSWGREDRFQRNPLWTDTAVSTWLSNLGLIALTLAVAGHLVIPPLRSWTEAAAFTAICLLSAGLVLRKSVRLVSWRTLAIICLSLLYAEFFHSGGGRLRIVALACAVALIFSLRFPLRRVKILIVAMIPFVLGWLARERLELQESLASGASEGRTGLESMIAPLKVFSLLIQALQERQFEPSYGYNLLSVPALIIPEAVWPAQPPALGYELVQFSAPERYADGVYSTVATSTGEGFFNFGWFGLLFVVILATIFLRTLDFYLSRYSHTGNITLFVALGLILIAMLAGAVADYTWSGVHTYVARMIKRLPLFLVILLLAWMRDMRQSRGNIDSRINGRAHVQASRLARP